MKRVNERAAVLKHVEWNDSRRVHCVQDQISAYTQDAVCVCVKLLNNSWQQCVCVMSVSGGNFDTTSSPQRETFREIHPGLQLYLQTHVTRTRTFSTRGSERTGTSSVSWKSSMSRCTDVVHHQLKASVFDDLGRRFNNQHHTAVIMFTLKAKLIYLFMIYLWFIWRGASYFPPPLFPSNHQGRRETKLA